MDDSSEEAPLLKVIDGGKKAAKHIEKDDKKMTEEIRKRLERVRKSHEVTKLTIRNNTPVMIDGSLLEDFDFLITQLDDALESFVLLKARHDELLERELKRLQNIEKFESEC